MFAMVSLQCGLNVDQGFGLTSLFTCSSTLFQTIIIIALPMLPSLLHFKYTILTDYVSFLVHTVLNYYYPCRYTLTLGIFYFGFSLGAVLWTGLYNQLTIVALKLFAFFNENPMYLMALFSGVLIFIELSYIMHNLVSTTVMLLNRQEGTYRPWVTVTCNNTEVTSVD